MYFFLLLTKKNLVAITSSIIILVLFLGNINLAEHPKMKKWVDNNKVINKVNTTEKVVSLTFDDGPDPQHTATIIDNLNKHNAKATFFVMGSKAEKNPELIKAMFLSGHEIGNHSYSHSDFNHKPNSFIINEIEKTNDIIMQITAQKPTLFRPPGGYLSIALVEEIMPELDMTISYWSYIQDSKDWKVGNKAQDIANYIVKHIAPGQIIILHDGTANSAQTALAVDLLLEELTKIDYKVVTMSELIKMGKQ